MYNYVSYNFKVPLHHKVMTLSPQIISISYHIARQMGEGSSPFILTNGRYNLERCTQKVDGESYNHNIKKNHNINFFEL